MLYGLYCSTTDIATLGFLDTFLFLTAASDVFTNIISFSSSISAHTGVMWGNPSADNVDIKTRFLPLKRLLNCYFESSVEPTD